MTTIGIVLVACGVSVLFTTYIYGASEQNSRRTKSGQRKKPCGTR